MINKNVGSDYHNLREAKSDKIYELLKEFISEFDVLVLNVKFDKRVDSDVELFIGYNFKGYKNS